MPSLAPADRVTIRIAEPADLDQLCRLIAEHAAYERADAPAVLTERLEVLLFGSAPRLYALLACDGTATVGYATWSFEVSTWQGTEYAHMDCLYVRDDWRGAGIGRRLFQEVAAAAASRGAGELQWQTPDWNERAVRFYRREGGLDKAKHRFTLSLPSALAEAFLEPE